MVRSAAAPRPASTRAFAVALAVWLIAAVALALPRAAAAQDAVDPPSRAARLAEATGRVWLFAADANEWLEVGRNRPLSTGDRIATDNDAYAEIALGTTVLRVAPATELEVTVLDDRSFSILLHGGSLAARLKTQDAAAGFTLATEEGRFVARTAGAYRFDRFERTSDVTVLSGQATFEKSGNALAVNAGQHAQFWLDGRGAPQYAMADVARDAFAGWADERDRADLRFASAAGSRYVSPEMVGAEDLDRHGRWEETGDYGAVWTPRSVPVDWAPYSHGHWAWVSPWGWTWVDDAPWGYAPFHYGRWVWYRERWGWAPGRYVQRPVYAPALVAWLGGPGLSIGVTIGGGRGFGGPSVGWVPLAPREVYVPQVRTSAIYVRNLNLPYVNDGDLIARAVYDRRRGEDRRDFANRKFPLGVTVVPASVLERRERVDAIAARFRNDPAVRDFSRDPRPIDAIAAPSVERPRFAPLPRDVRAGIRPPFEGRAPGFMGRIDGSARPYDRNGDGRLDRGERGDRAADRAERIERGDRGERPIGTDRTDRTERTDRVGRPDSADRPDRIGIPRGFPRSDDVRGGPAVRNGDERTGDPRRDRIVGTQPSDAGNVPPPPRGAGEGRGDGRFGPPAGPGRFGPPDTRVGPPETTRVGPPEIRVGPPDTRVGPPDTTRVGPPDGTRVGPPDTTRVGPPDGTRVGPPTTRMGPPETRVQPGDIVRPGQPRMGVPEMRAPPPQRMETPQAAPPPPRMEAPRAAPPPQAQPQPQPARPAEVQRPAAPPAPREPAQPRAEDRRGPGGGGGGPQRERER